MLFTVPYSMLGLPLPRPSYVYSSTSESETRPVSTLIRLIIVVSWQLILRQVSVYGGESNNTAKIRQFLVVSFLLKRAAQAELKIRIQYWNPHPVCKYIVIKTDPEYVFGTGVCTRIRNTSRYANIKIDFGI
jgi:hypothetical protein